MLLSLFSILRTTGRSKGKLIAFAFESEKKAQLLLLGSWKSDKKEKLRKEAKSVNFTRSNCNIGKRSK